MNNLSIDMAPFRRPPQRLTERVRTGVFAALFLLTFTANAQAPAEEEDWTFSYSGFGTLGAVHHGASDVEFRRDIGQLDGVKSNRIGISPDTNLGLQLTTRFRQKFEASVQMVSRMNTNGDYGPDLAWAFVKYRPSDNLSFRAGRLGVEMYLQGDAAEIGYAKLMVRQPIIFYPRTLDGGDMEWSLPMNSGVLRTKAFGGWTVGKIANGGAIYDSAGSLIRGGLVEYAQGGWTGRVAAVALSLRDDLSDANTRTLRALIGATPNGSRINDRLSMKDRTIDHFTAAVAYEADALQGLLSVSRESSDGWADRKIVFGNLGYRLGAWTPYVGYSAIQTDRGILSTGVPGFVPGAAQMEMIAGIAQGGLVVNQSDWALGIRYDLTRNSVLKLQLDRIRYKDPEGLMDSSLLHTRFEDRRNKSFSLFSAALDFVF